MFDTLSDPDLRSLDSVESMRILNFHLEFRVLFVQRIAVMGARRAAVGKNESSASNSGIFLSFCFSSLKAI